MLQLTDITLRRDGNVLFDGASAQIHAGHRVGVIGANGTGKSSLFAMLLGELDSDHGHWSLDPDAVIAHVAQHSPSGRHSALDHVLDGDPEWRRLKSELDALDSDQPTAADGRRMAELTEALERIDGFRAEARAARLLAGLGFQPGDADRPVADFSGGWRMRLNLAQALMQRSDVLLLDEPTNHLDLPAILWLEDWLLAYDGILMVISHDRDFLDTVCTHVLHIERKSVTAYRGGYSQFERLRAERLSQQQAMFEKQQREVAHIRRYVDRFRYKASKARQAQSRLKMLERMTTIAPAHVDAEFHFEFLSPDRHPDPVVELEGATLGHDDVAVLRDVQLRLGAGDRLGLLGPNGAGKSTLIRALAEGSTLLGGDRHVHPQARIGYFAQMNLDQLDTERSPLAHLREAHPEWDEQRLRDVLGRFGFGGDRAEQPVAPLSGGEKARLVLALVVNQAPNLLLLDEPTNHLDIDMREALTRALAGFDGAVVLISHDRHLLRATCDALLHVIDGRVEPFDGDLDDYARAQRLNAERGERSNPAGDRRRQARRDRADRRARLKPLRDRVRHAEREVEQLSDQHTRLSEQLADPSLYDAGDRSEEVARLTREQARLRERLEAAEREWLDASEVLEQAVTDE